MVRFLTTFINFFSEINLGKKSIFDSFINSLAALWDLGTINKFNNNCKIKNNKESLGRFNKVLLVTSSYHMRRSLAIADKLGINITPYVTDYIGVPYSSFMDYLLPSIDALQGFHSLVHEWIGYVAYSIRGYC